MTLEFTDSEKTILKVVGIAGGALLVYWYLKQSGYWDQWFGSSAAVAPAPVAPTGQPGIAPDPNAVNPYAQAMNAMSAAAQSPLMTADQWAMLWMNSQPFAGAPIGFGVPGSITANVMQGLQAAAGGQAISAAQFVNLKLQQQQAGLAGPRGVGLAQSASWVN